MSVSSRISVQQWLAQIEPPPTRRNDTATTAAKKRKRDDDLAPPPQRRKGLRPPRRVALGEMSDNVARPPPSSAIKSTAAAASEERTTTRSTRSKAQRPPSPPRLIHTTTTIRTPRRPRKQVRPPNRDEMETVEDDGEHDDGQATLGAQAGVMDMDATPRAPASVFSAPSIARSSASGASSRDSAASSRSRSPTKKKMAAFMNLEGGGVRSKTINVYEKPNASTNDHDRALSDIWDNYIVPLARLMDRRGILSPGMRDTLAAHKQLEARDLSGSLDVFDSTGGRRALGEDAAVDEVHRIARTTNHYMTEQESEAAWNCAVHWPIASLALETSEHAKQNFELKNITTAQIDPPSLAPRLPSGERLGAKMVDLAYVAQPNGAIDDGFQYLRPSEAPPPARSASIASYNHTTSSTLLNKPIAISIETKSSSTSSETALPQLTTWVLAHFARLAQLHADSQTSPEPFRPPALFLVVVSGDSWRFFVATHVHGQGTVIHDMGRSLGSRKLNELYAILACLHKLLEWADKFYLPWFEHNAVPRRT